MKFWLNTDVVKRLIETSGQLHRGLDQVGMGTIYDADNLRWFACTGCYWVSLTYSPPENHPAGWGGRTPLCPRDPSDTLGHLSRGLAGRYERGDCGPTVWLAEIAPRIDSAMHTALRLEGTNAVIKILDTIEPIVMGIDCPGSHPHYFDFPALRPNSATSEHGWFATSDPKRKR